MDGSLKFLKLIAAVLACGTALAGCSTSAVTGKRQLILISEQQEIALGAEAAAEFEQKFGGPVPDAVLQNYVREVGRKIAAVSDRPMPYQYTLLRSDVANAFALPGGKIYITAGLLWRMRSERELAAVLGHETVHVAARHNILGMQRQMGAGLLAEIAGIIVGENKQKAARAATQVATGMINLRYSRNDEYEADRYGMKYMEKAGYNPWGMVEMLTRLYEMHESEPDNLWEFFQSHPLTSKRIEQARKIIREEYPQWSSESPDPHASRFLQMRSRLKKRHRSNPSRRSSRPAEILRERTARMT